MRTPKPTPIDDSRVSRNSAFSSAKTSAVIASAIAGAAPAETLPAPGDDDDVLTVVDGEWASAPPAGGGGGLTVVSVSTAGPHATTTNTKNISTYGGGQTVWALPATSAVGDELIFSAHVLNDARITQAALQYITATDSRVSTTGTDGFLDFNGNVGSVHLMCVEANKGWQMIGGASEATDYNWG